MMGVPELRLFVFLVVAIVVSGLIVAGIVYGLRRKP